MQEVRHDSKGTQSGEMVVSRWQNGADVDKPLTANESRLPGPGTSPALRLQLTFFRYDTVLLLFLHELREDSTSFLTRVR